MRQLLILNLILVAVVCAGIVRFRNDYVIYQGSHQPGAIQPPPESLPKAAASSSANSVPSGDWTEIPGRNLFSFDRTDVPIVETVAPPPPPGAKPILFGTM